MNQNDSRIKALELKTITKHSIESQNFKTSGNWDFTNIASNGKPIRGSIYSQNNHPTNHYKSYGRDWNESSNLSSLISSDSNWSTISTSGQHTVAALNGGYIYISLNYGLSWTAIHHTAKWCDCCISDDGSHMFVTDEKGIICHSTNYGVTLDYIIVSSQLYNMCLFT